MRRRSLLEQAKGISESLTDPQFQLLVAVGGPYKKAGGPLRTIERHPSYSNKAFRVLQDKGYVTQTQEPGAAGRGPWIAYTPKALKWMNRVKRNQEAGISESSEMVLQDLPADRKRLIKAVGLKHGGVSVGM